MTWTVVTGAGGFIGSHLVRRLVRDGHRVRGVDLVPPRYGPGEAQEFVIADLRDAAQAARAVAGADSVFALAANMGGIGWTHTAPAEILHDNLLISTHTIEACRAAGVRTTVYTSSACVYPASLQREPDAAPLAEDPVFPAEPDMEYGWEKLTTEILCGAYRRSHGMDIKTARLHAIYGPLGTYTGPRAKSLSMLCDKVARIPGDEGEIEVWGDGTQTRSYCYVDDCVEGLIRLARSDVAEPVNIGSEERVDIASLVERIAGVAGKKVRCAFAPDRPVGPRGRVSDNTRCRELLGWAPETSLAAGLERTYPWIERQVLAEAGRADA
uniref:Sugar epimerase BlmG n=1 Tax=Streptomyces verticillus TaxID=29309 RepID=Q9FB21_9ACTN|nr:sugar epimerase BlmG [Streptomyces verticillus]